MSKKNKKHKVDYFNMTPEEQMANAEMFHDVEKGDVSFLDALNYKVPTGPVAQSDYTKQIERACLGIIEKDEDDNYINEVEIAMGYVKETVDESKEYTNDDHNGEYIAYSEDEKDDEEIDTEYASPFSHTSQLISDKISMDITVDNAPKEPSVEDKDRNNDNISPIFFRYNPTIGRVIIDDGLIATAVSVCHSSSIQLQDECIPDDSDEFSSLVSKLFFYIISFF